MIDCQHTFNNSQLASSECITLEVHVCEALSTYVTQAWDADLLAAREAAAVREAAHAADFSAARAAALAKQHALAERLSAASAKVSRRGGPG